MYSVLSNLNQAIINKTPFPYLIIDNALPDQYYSLLNDSFPTYLKIINKREYFQNFAYRYNASQSLFDDLIPPIWKKFIKFHTSFSFVEQVYTAFGESIFDYYPNARGKLPNNKNCGVRHTGQFDFNLDCQFVINTPVDEESAVIEPHLDNPKEFFAALLYMRNSNDNSVGGNLVSYRFKDKPIFYGKSRVKNENVIKLEEIEYRSNRLVLFINTLNSIHGVSKRNITSHYRKYMNIIGEFNFELFDFRRYLE